MDNIFIEQLENITNHYNECRQKSQYNDASDIISNTEVRQLQTRALAAISRTAGKNSVYYDKADSILSEKDHSYNHLAGIIGVAESLLYDAKAGYLKSLEELIHADIFSDFLEMAMHLIKNGYKDAAAVMAGSTLEAHLKQLAQKHSIDLEHNGRPKKADQINSELVKATAYSKLDQKNVTAWLGLRNNAAHGQYEEYDKQQVNLFISSIQDFITRNPA
jgi:hypothetical protein